MTQRPAIGETLNHGRASVPRPSATVILLRDGDPGKAVLIGETLRVFLPGEPGYDIALG